MCPGGNLWLSLDRYQLLTQIIKSYLLSKSVFPLNFEDGLVVMLELILVCEANTIFFL